jgi:hypothetical protein
LDSRNVRTFLRPDEEKELIGVCLERKGDSTAKKQLLDLHPDSCLIECDYEATFAVSVLDREFLKVAKNLLEVRQSPWLSEERREHLRRQMSNVRAKLVGEGVWEA